MKGRTISNWSPRSEPTQAKRWEAEVREAMRTSTPSIPLIVLDGPPTAEELVTKYRQATNEERAEAFAAAMAEYQAYNTWLWDLIDEGIDTKGAYQDVDAVARDRFKVDELRDGVGLRQWALGLAERDPRGCEVVRWSTGVRVLCKAAHAHVCMYTLRVACLPVLYVGSSRVTTGWRVILSASGWADLTSRVWRTQLRCDPKPRLWPGGFGTFRKRTDMSGDALGTRSLSTPLPMVAEHARNRATDPYFVLPSSDVRAREPRTHVTWHEARGFAPAGLVRPGRFIPAL